MSCNPAARARALAARARWVVVGVGGVVAALGLATPTAAHEKTTSGVDVAVTLLLTPDGVTVLVEARLGELATVPEVARLDRDGDGRVTDAERAEWEAALRERLRAGLPLVVAGGPAEATVQALATQFPLGPVGLPELHLRAELKAAWPAAAAAQGPEVEVRLMDGLWPAAPGHRRIVVTGQPTGSVRYRIDKLADPLVPGHDRPTGATARYRR